MFDVACVTLSVDVPVRPCVTRDHNASCDGKLWVFDAGTGDYVRTTADCDGCVPRAAAHGLLCEVCWRRLNHAFFVWSGLRSTLMMIDRAVSNDSAGVRSDSGWVLPIPATRLTVDEVDRFEASRLGTLEAWVEFERGAADAVQFTRSVERAQHAFPTEEKPHRVRRFRCPDCGLLSLMWTPPSAFREPVTVSCQNRECGRVLDAAAVDTLATILGGA